MKLRSILLVAAGFILLGVGAVGIVVPVWPTTPFVIAAAACFSCTPKLRAWLMRVPFFSEHIANYQMRKGLAKRTVAISLIFLWGMLLISMLLVGTPWIIALLAVVGTCVTIHILLIARPKDRGAKDPLHAEGDSA